MQYDGEKYCPLHRGLQLFKYKTLILHYPMQYFAQILSVDIQTTVTKNFKGPTHLASKKFIVALSYGMYDDTSQYNSLQKHRELTIGPAKSTIIMN